MILRLIIYALIAYLAYRGLKALILPKKRTLYRESGKVIDEMVQDPFCGKYVPRRDALRRAIKGEDFYFCSESCADQFEKQDTGHR